MRAVDTNVVLRLVTRDDPRQAAIADEFVRGGAWVSHVVLAEVAWALESVYGLAPKPIAAALAMLLEHESLALQEPGVVAAALDRLRSYGSVGFADCLILEIARQAGHVPLGTFDRRLAKLSGAEKL